MGPVDLTSGLFLGLPHRGPAGRPAPLPLTTGVPAGLAEAPTARRVAAAVASWQGAEAGLVTRSALHALVDVLTSLPGHGDLVAVDRAAYPLSRWAAQLAVTTGAQVIGYDHFRPALLARLPVGRRVFAVTDGWCPGCGRAAPIAALREIVAPSGGAVVVDDTLALGVLGRRSAAVRGPAARVWGDGSGVPARAGVPPAGVVQVSSLAKALGAPLAVIAADAGVVARLVSSGGTRDHCSPPSSADLTAASDALGAVADGRAAAARERLWRNVSAARSALVDAGVPPTGAPFPVVTVPLPSVAAARAWVAGLTSHGVRAVHTLRRCAPGHDVSLLMRADLTDDDLARVRTALRRVARTVAA
jgi:8-amino-7-oxononanoate synthase